MIIDVTGIYLLPGNGGDDCPGNGRHRDENGEQAECCCDECDYMMCCISDDSSRCADCTDGRCPRSQTAAGSDAHVHRLETGRI